MKLETEETIPSIPFLSFFLPSFFRLPSFHPVLLSFYSRSLLRLPPPSFIPRAKYGNQRDDVLSHRILVLKSCKRERDDDTHV